MNTERRRGKHGGRNGAQTSSRYYGVCYIQAKKVMWKPWTMRFYTDIPWRASVTVGGKKVTKHFPTEREAAIQVDKWVLRYRLNAPLNILKPKA